jgi:hypothetical protein
MNCVVCKLPLDPDEDGEFTDICDLCQKEQEELNDNLYVYPLQVQYGESIPEHWYQVFEHQDCEQQIRPKWTYDVTEDVRRSDLRDKIPSKLEKQFENE